MKLITFIKYVKAHILPIALVIGGIIDQTTDLLAQFLIDIEAPVWAPTLLRIVIISFGAVKLYISTPNLKKL